jgi:hypothetical protein
MSTAGMLIGIPARLLRERYVDDSPAKPTGKSGIADDA